MPEFEVTTDTPYPPLDISALKKGDYISPEELERIVCTPRGTNSYAFKVLEVKEFIRKASIDNGEPLLTKQEQYGLRVLTDSEALDYKERQHELRLQGIRRTFIDLTHIDVRNLTTPESQRHTSAVLCQSRVIQAMNRERNKLMQEGHVRTTPSLGPAKDL